jgi:Protein of unknown function (DUF3800)
LCVVPLTRGGFLSMAAPGASEATFGATSVNRLRCARTESVIFFTVRSNASVLRLAGNSVLPIVTPVKLAFRCDSSSHRDARYMVAGGVAFQTRRYTDISAAIQGIKNAASIKSEMKWAKFRGGERSRAYEGIVDLFFSLIEQNQIHFHCIIAEFGAFSHGAFEGASPESSVSRMYYQLLVHRVCRYYAKKCYIWVYPDQGNDSRDLLGYGGMINLAANKKYRVEHRLVSIEQSNSARCNLLQMVDIIIGGIAHLRNFPVTTGGTGHKIALARYILKKSGLPAWDIDTGRRARRLTVWNFRHQKLIAKEKAPQSARRRYVRQG